MKNSARHLLSLSQLGSAEVRSLLRLALRLKADQLRGKSTSPLPGRVLGLLFTKPSTRTRISFQVAMAQLGGQAIAINPQEIQLNRGESLEDTARVLSRYLDALVIRTFHQEELEAWARHSGIPIINGLSDYSHPCQILSDLVTLLERRGKLRGLKIAYIGDGNNVAHSWILAAGLLGLDLHLAVPKGYEPLPEVVRRGAELAPRSRGKVRITHDPKEAAQGADVLYTDVWTSMGQERERKRRLRDFKGFQINRTLLDSAKAGALVMHCLPAHRGEEITSEVLDGEQSVVLDQAENRLHLQKALLLEYLTPPAESRVKGKRGKKK